MALKFWSNVQVAVQSALGAAKTISGITKADPGVATSTSHGLSNGAYVFLEIQGMHQLNFRVVRIANVATDTFELEGVDTTAFETFTSGTAKAVTFGTTLSTLTNVNASGGDPTFADTTTIHSNIETQVPVSTSALSFGFDSHWDYSDAGLIALNEAYEAIAQRAFLFTFSDGAKTVFAGYVSAPLAPTGQRQGVVTTPVTVTVNGRITNYTS